MTKKLIVSIIVVLIAGAFVGSTFYINSLNKAQYEQITQLDMNNLKASVASALKPFFESQGLDSTVLLDLAEELDISLEASPYVSGFLHSEGTLTLKLKMHTLDPHTLEAPSSTLYIDARFSNLPFGTSVFSISSPDSEVKELFSDGKIGSIELNGTTIALRLSDVFIQRDTWRDTKDTLSLKGFLLTLHTTKDFALKSVLFTIPEFSLVERGDRFGFTDLVVEGSYDTPLDLQTLLKYTTEGAILAGKSSVTLRSLEVTSGIKLTLDRFSVKGVEKLGSSPDLSDIAMDLAFKNLVIADNFPYASEDRKNLKLNFTDFSSTLEIQNLHRFVIGYLDSFNDPYAFLLRYGEDFERKIQAIFSSNPKLAIKDSSFLFNGKKITYSGNGQITPEFGEFNFTISSKFSIQELLDQYKGMGDFDTIIEGLSEYFIKQGDSAYGTTLRYHQIHDGAQSFKVNDTVIYQSRYESPDNADEETLDEPILDEDDLQELDSQSK